MRFIITFLIFSLTLNTLSSQEEKNNESGAFLLQLSYGVHTPQGDLGDRFGLNFSTGASFEYMTSAKSNLTFGIEYNFYFGNRVFEDVLAPFRSELGFIYGNNQAIADIVLRERGFYAGISIAKLLPLSSNNKRSGIRIKIGTGLLQHKIRILVYL